MLFVLFFRIFSAEFAGIEVGSQFFKFALSTNDGQAKIFTDPITNSVLFSTATAIKFLKPHDPPFSPSDFDDIELRFASHALPILKRNSSLGYEFTPYFIERNSTLFNQTRIVGPHMLLPLLYHRTLQNIPKFDQISLSVPSHYTRRQIQILSFTLQMIGIEANSIVDDCTSVFLLYSSVRTSRFVSEPKHVMFIDVGASHTAAFSAVFTYTNDGYEVNNVNQTAYDFSEKISGFALADALSKKTGITFQKAMKKIIRTGCEGLENMFLDEMSELTDLIQRVMEEAEKVRPIDEVQLIGGASNYKLVAQTIKEASNHTIRRDFNANEAIATGAAIASMVMNEKSAFIPSVLQKKPSLNMNITCGNETFPVCYKNDKCIEFIDFSGKCDIINFYADERDIAAGTNTNVMNYIIRQDIPEKATIRAYTQNAETSHIYTQYCLEDGTCYPLESEEEDNPQQITDSLNFLNNFMDSYQKRKIVEIIGSMLDKLLSYFEKLDNVKIEATYQITEEMRESIMKYQELRESNELETLSKEEITEIYQTCENAMKSLHLHL